MIIKDLDALRKRLKKRKLFGILLLILSLFLLIRPVLGVPIFLIGLYFYIRIPSWANTLEESFFQEGLLLLDQANPSKHSNPYLVSRQIQDLTLFTLYDTISPYQTLTGSYKGITFTYCYLHAYSTIEDTIEDIFKGDWFILEGFDHLEGELQLREKSLFTGSFRMLSPDTGSIRIKELEPCLNDNYKIYASHPKTAHLLLNDVFCTHLLALANQAYYTLIICLKDHKLHIGVRNFAHKPFHTKTFLIQNQEKRQALLKLDAQRILSVIELLYKATHNTNLLSNATHLINPPESL